MSWKDCLLFVTANLIARRAHPAKALCRLSSNTVHEGIRKNLNSAKSSSSMGIALIRRSANLHMESMN